MKAEEEKITMMQSCGQRTVGDDATFLPLPHLVLNSNSHIFVSFLIFCPGHAVPSGIALFVFHTFLFLLNIPNFKQFIYIQSFHYTGTLTGEKTNQTKKVCRSLTTWSFQSLQAEKLTAGWQMQIVTGLILLQCLSFQASAILPICLCRTRARLNGGLIQETNLTGLESTGKVCCVVIWAVSSNQNQEPSY